MFVYQRVRTMSKIQSVPGENIPSKRMIKPQLPSESPLNNCWLSSNSVRFGWAVGSFISYTDTKSHITQYEHAPLRFAHVFFSFCIIQGHYAMVQILHTFKQVCDMYDTQ